MDGRAFVFPGDWAVFPMQPLLTHTISRDVLLEL